MNTTLRILAAALLALWLAIPGISGEGDGGENAGGTGVWILPRSEFLSSGSGMQGRQPRTSPIAIPNLQLDVKLRVSSETGQCSGTLFDGLSNTPVDLPVIGQSVILPASLMQALFAARVPACDIVIVDAAHRGYLMTLTFDYGTGGAQILVY